jgi:integrase
MMAINPYLKIDPLPVEPGGRFHITEEEWNRFLLAAGPKRPFFLPVFYTLGRVGETLRLKWADSDWEREEIRLWTGKRKGGRWKRIGSVCPQSCGTLCGVFTGVRAAIRIMYL